MSDRSERENMVGGYGSDDNVRISGDSAETTGEGDTSQIPGVLADVSPEASNKGESEPSGPAGAHELGSSAPGVDNLAGGTNSSITDGTSGLGKGG
ncbi:MAG TPA: hypothetical protein VFZ66_10005 [Herpetosiphonaceae bacterium]